MNNLINKKIIMHNIKSFIKLFNYNNNYFNF